MSILTTDLMNALEALKPETAGPMVCDTVYASGCWSCGDECTYDYTA